MSKNSGSGCCGILFWLLMVPVVCFVSCAACTAGMIQGAQPKNNTQFQTPDYGSGKRTASAKPSASIKKSASAKQSVKK